MSSSCKLFPNFLDDDIATLRETKIGEGGAVRKRDECVIVWSPEPSEPKELGEDTLRML